MMEFYPQIKMIHVVSVLASGGLFLLRGLLVQAQRAHWANATPVRYLSYTIDTVLLTAAVMLVAILPGAMFANGWLTVKLVLLVAYVVLGVMALKREKRRGRRALYFLAALGVFAFMLSVARAHHPLGFLASVF